MLILKKQKSSEIQTKDLMEKEGEVIPHDLLVPKI